MGVYVLVFKVNSFRNGQLTGFIERDLIYVIGATQSNLPQVFVSNVNSTVPIAPNGNSLEVEMHPGDTLGLLFTTSISSFDTVSIFGDSPLFGNTAGTAGNCSGNNCALFSAVSGSFSGLLNVNALLHYTPDTSVLIPGIDEYKQTILISGIKNATCDVTPFVVTITVKKPGSIWAIQPNAICLGDTTQGLILGDTTNLLWIPSAGVSNPQSGSPKLYPSATTKYTVVNLNDTTQIEVTVNVDTIAPASLIDNSTWVQLPNFTDYDQVVWYYNGIPLATNTDSFAMPWPGDYYAHVFSGACSAFSDTVIKVNKNMSPVFGNGSGVIVSTDGWAEFEFALNGVHGNVLQSLNIALPDSGTYKTGSEPWFLLTDGNQTVVATGTASKVSEGFYSLTGLNLNLNPNETYKLFVDLYEGATVFSVPPSFPYTAPNGAITILSARYDHGGVQKTDAYPPVVFGLSSGIGLVEVDEAEVIAYPNPTNDRLFIKTEKAARIKLLSTTGKLLFKGQKENIAEIDMSNLASGVYILEVEQEGKLHRQKVVKQ
jgi:hypothetical protein